MRSKWEDLPAVIGSDGVPGEFVGDKSSPYFSLDAASDDGQSLSLRIHPRDFSYSGGATN